MSRFAQSFHSEPVIRDDRSASPLVVTAAAGIGLLVLSLLPGRFLFALILIGSGLALRRRRRLGRPEGITSGHALIVAGGALLSTYLVSGFIPLALGLLALWLYFRSRR